MATLLAGYAECNITPPVRAELCGYGIFLGRRSTGINEPLKARALVLDSSEGPVAIVTADLCNIAIATVSEMRAEIARRGIMDPANTLVACSHTHSGPATYWLIGWGELCPPYMAALPHYLAGAVEMAAGAMKPVRIGCGRGSITGIAENRVEGDAGPLNEEIKVIRLDVEAGNPFVVLYNYACHGVTNFHTNTLINPDWIGFASREVTRELGGHAMFLQGCCGDVNPRNVHTGKVAETGVPVGCEVARIAAQVSTKPGGRAAMRAMPFTIPFAPPNPREEMEALLAENRDIVARTEGDPEVRGEWAMARFNCEYAQLALAELAGTVRPGIATELDALQVGESLLLCHGGEMFTEYGDRMKAASGVESTLVVGYANDSVGYIPDPEDHARGGYAAAMVPRIFGNWPYVTNAGDLICDALLELGSKL